MMMGQPKPQTKPPRRDDAERAFLEQLITYAMSVGTSSGVRGMAAGTWEWVKEQPWVLLPMSQFMELTEPFVDGSS